MRRSITFFLVLLASVEAQEYPPAQQILEMVRMQQARQDLALEGQLREGGRIIPFRLTQSGPVIRYSFRDPDEALQLRLGDDNSRLETVTAAGVDRVAGPEFGEKVRGTPITYEDLALRFLYWPEAKVLGEDYIHTRRVWKLELKPPGRQSQYSRLFLWVEQKSGALLRLHGFDGNGKLSKRFDVISIQTIEGRNFLKQMRIEELQPTTGKVQSRTYLEIKK